MRLFAQQGKTVKTSSERSGLWKTKTLTPMCRSRDSSIIHILPNHHQLHHTQDLDTLPLPPLSAVGSRSSVDLYTLEPVYKNISSNSETRKLSSLKLLLKQEIENPRKITEFLLPIFLIELVRSPSPSRECREMRRSPVSNPQFCGGRAKKPLTSGRNCHRKHVEDG